VSENKQEAQLSLGWADRTSYIPRPASSDFQKWLAYSQWRF